MPKFNMYQSLHTTVIGPEGRPLEIQIRTPRDARDGRVRRRRALDLQGRRAAAARARPGRRRQAQVAALAARLAAGARRTPASSWRRCKVDLFEDEVFVFTPKGEVKSLAAGATPLDFAYEVHTEVGHRCVGAKVNGKIVPLHYELQSGDIVEILTSKRERGPSRDWLGAGQDDARAQQDQAVVQGRVAQGHRAHRARAAAGAPAQAGPAGAEDHRLAAARRRDPRDGLPQGRRLLHRARRGQGLAEGRRQQGHAAPQAGRGGRRRADRRPTCCSTGAQPPAARRRPRRSTGSSVEGVDDVMLRLAKCCRPVPGDQIVGYISLGRGITIHREDCPNAGALRKDPERFTEVSWDGEGTTAFRVEIQVDAWDRHRLLEDLSRAFAESGVEHPRGALHCRPTDGQEPLRRRGAPTRRRSTARSRRLRNIDAVFDAYRVTPSARRVGRSGDDVQRAGQRPSSAPRRRRRGSRRRPAAAAGARRRVRTVSRVELRRRPVDAAVAR